MESSENNQSPEQWEKKFLQELAMSSLVEKRRTRRWGIFFKSITAVYLFIFLMLMVGLMAPGEFQEAGIKKQAPHTALVNVSGIIMDETEASADNVVTGLRNAFKNKHTKGVIIRINSPGGTPVQAGYIHTEILRLKEKHPDIPVYAVVSDMAASGGYYVAVAADEIYVDKASIVGSIGVLMNGFGFVDGMEKLGVERRLFTAGEHKGINDPFSPVTEFDRKHVQLLLDQMHQQFIDAVKKGRGDRLQPDDKIFSGLYWTGEESIKLGLADGLGSSSYVARELIKEEEIVDYTPAEDLLERFARKMGASTGQTLSRIWGFTDLPLPR